MERIISLMTGPPVHGVYAAVLTPRHPDNSIDEPALTRLTEFLLEREISGFALNGATGEFCLSTPHHLKTLLSAVRRTASNAKILCGIGTAGTAGTIELAKIAAGEGAQAVLLPMPYFFPYGQEDLAAFAETVAASVSLPVLLYNLPEFTSALDPETSCGIIGSVPNVIGIKDSGRSLATLRQLTQHQISCSRMVGNDGILVDALREDVCDGVVSGVACVLPELIRDLFNERANTGGAHFQQLSQLLRAFRQQLAQFPTPWALKWIAEARGICSATFSQPVTGARREQGRKMIEWFHRWQAKLSALTQPVP
jgi:4-hydroxy-tetrahydrodipicolinate synthase